MFGTLASDSLPDAENVALRRLPSCTTQPLEINSSRMMESLHATCGYGQAHAYGEDPTETGVARLALDDNDTLVRHWLIEQVQAVGCTVTIDQMGNIFAVRAGKENDVAPIMMGSHLDTQPTGGRYDGILGVHAALEVLRTLHENDFQTNGPVGLVNWTNEEGARFPIITVASGVWAGAIDLEDAWTCQEVLPSHNSKRQTLKQELQRGGFLGDTPASFKSQPIAAFFELHIEQGPILEDEGLKIGVVIGAQAYRWFEVTIEGKDSHAGTTPMSARKDALLAASKMIVESNRIAKSISGLVTTGIIQAMPASVNTTAHTVRFTLDVRHPDDLGLSEMIGQFRESFAKIAEEDCEAGVIVHWNCLTENNAVNFDEGCIAAIEQSAEEVLAQHIQSGSKEPRLWKRMVSGAGHDSCHVSRRCPTAMIFTPTRNGMSHTPDEYCSPEDCSLGAQVLLGAVLRYDSRRSSQVF